MNNNQINILDLVPNLPDDQATILEGILSPISYHADSIYLTGSWASENNTHHSDIDILIVVSTEEKRKLVQEYITSLKLDISNKIPLDLKVISNLGGLLNPKKRFFYWSQLRKGICCYGNQIRIKEFSRSQVEALLNHMIDTINEVCVNIESNLMYTGNIATLYDISKTIYFIDYHFQLLDTSFTMKDEFLVSFLKQTYSSSRRSYYEWVSQNSSGTSLKVPKKTDAKISEKKYAYSLQIAMEISSCLQHIKYKLSMLEKTGK